MAWLSVLRMAFTSLKGFMEGSIEKRVRCGYRTQVLKISETSASPVSATGDDDVAFGVTGKCETREDLRESVCYTIALEDFENNSCSAGGICRRLTHFPEVDPFVERQPMCGVSAHLSVIARVIRYSWSYTP